MSRPAGETAAPPAVLHPQLDRSAIYVAVSGVGCSTYPESIRTGIAVAQQGLDLFSTRGLADLATVDTENEHVALWHENGAAVLRVVSISLLNASIGATLDGA
jgi:hypothetical protein